MKTSKRQNVREKRQTHKNTGNKKWEKNHNKQKPIDRWS